MSRRGLRANLRDVAEAAGVSMQTASRVVRGVDVVAEATRERVMIAVKQLNYQPNLAARSLSARRTGSVHVIDAVPLFHGHATAFVVICQKLSEMDLHTSTTIIPTEDFDSLALSDLVPVGADGVIILGGRAEPNGWVSKIASTVPTVYVGQKDGLPESVVGVALDHRSGARLAVEHLIERGARHLAHVAGPQDWVDARLRLEGFQAACAEAGVRATVLHAESWDATSAGPLMADLPADVDAVFAGNDQLALGCMTALQRAGRSVPGDVKVVGFDNVPGSESFLPPLTTIQQDFRGVGERAVVALGKLLDGVHKPEPMIAPSLVVREST